jgi:acetoin utilization deacetylase AcuC-like enzyme
MKYTEAKAKALLLTATRQLTHVIYKTDGGYEVAMEKNWTGEIFETVKYEAEKENKPEPKKATAKRNYPTQSED